jgi:hypothetical protein
MGMLLGPHAVVLF